MVTVTAHHIFHVYHKLCWYDINSYCASLPQLTAFPIDGQANNTLLRPTYRLLYDKSSILSIPLYLSAPVIYRIPKLLSPLTQVYSVNDKHR